MVATQTQTQIEIQAQTKQHIWVAVCLSAIIALALALGLMSMPGSPGLTHDSANFLSAAENMAKTGRFIYSVPDTLSQKQFEEKNADMRGDQVVVAGCQNQLRPLTKMQPESVHSLFASSHDYLRLSFSLCKPQLEQMYV